MSYLIIRQVEVEFDFSGYACTPFLELRGGQREVKLAFLIGEATYIQGFQPDVDLVGSCSIIQLDLALDFQILDSFRFTEGIFGTG